MDVIFSGTPSSLKPLLFFSSSFICLSFNKTLLFSFLAFFKCLSKYMILLLFPSSLIFSLAWLKLFRDEPGILPVFTFLLFSKFISSLILFLSLFFMKGFSSFFLFSSFSFFKSISFLILLFKFFITFLSLLDISFSLVLIPFFSFFCLSFSFIILFSFIYWMALLLS